MAKAQSAGGRLRSTVGKRLPRRFKNAKLNLRKIELSKVSEHSRGINWTLVVIAVFLAAEVTSRILGLMIRPIYPAIPRKPQPLARNASPTEDFDAILRRNMFNVEGKIPEPFDQGLLDCMSQAKPSSARLVLMGTIVMSDERYSVALVTAEGNPQKVAVKKDEEFLGKYTALKVERKKLCFQVRETQELEYIEIPDDSAGLGVSSLNAPDTGSGITPVSENEYMVKNDFLQKNLLNLNEVLQTARAVPYVDTRTGKFQGFLVQSIDATSPFAQLGIRQGDVLTGVNDIVLDNPGKGLEAFQKLRESKKISLEVIRGGQKQSMSYDVK